MVAVGSSVAAAAALVAYPIAGGQALRYAAAGLLLVGFARGTLPRLTRSQAARLIALAATGLAGFNAFLIAAVRHADTGSVGVIVGASVWEKTASVDKGRAQPVIASLPSRPS